ncbi:LytR/AlgR family response regulator transcription factor [Bacillus sp. N9]
MLRAIIIDNEEIPMKYLEQLLHDTNAVKVIGRYTKGSKAIHEIEQFNPDLIFLDSIILGESGIEVAKNIKALLPKSKIVFVTAYEKFAIKAFEIGVTDYILKPFKKERIDLLIDRILDTENRKVEKDVYTVCSFNYFHFKKMVRKLKM